MWIGPIIWILLLALGVWLATALVRRNGCVDRSGAAPVRARVRFSTNASLAAKSTTRNTVVDAVPLKRD